MGARRDATTTTYGGSDLSGGGRRRCRSAGVYRVSQEHDVLLHADGSGREQRTAQCGDGSGRTHDSSYMPPSVARQVEVADVQARRDCGNFKSVDGGNVKTATTIQVMK